ncbi:site-specific integrase (plasmid) [Sutcliffiella horikoshii]|uniref:tyrosine-type recombinase/integrase n=1 Tax=Sutcliffiella horikoshii TaxID=79883 RepID=UPI001CBEABC6|nr:site-specific integrase [Sutcliffiella horikoshii]UAL49755.1 site-specific integrase [Sutcliffiella horikoshii]
MSYGFKQYLVDEGYKEKTITTYLTCVEWFFAYLNSTHKKQPELHEINPSDIKGFMASKLDDGNSIHSINKHIAVLKTFFDYLWRINKVSIDPAVKIQRMKVLDAGPNDISYKQLLNLKPKILGDSRYNLITKSIYILALKGLRFSEFHFRKCDVSIDNQGVVLISINTRKNKRRVVKLKDADASVFESFYIDTQFNPGDYVFTTKRQHTNEYVPIEIDSLYTYLKYIRDDYSLPKRFKLDDIRIAYVHYLRSSRHYVIDQIAENLGIEIVRAAELSKLAIERYNS